MVVEFNFRCVWGGGGVVRGLSCIIDCLWADVITTAFVLEIFIDILFFTHQFTESWPSSFDSSVTFSTHMPDLDIVVSSPNLSRIDFLISRGRVSI